MDPEYLSYGDAISWESFLAACRFCSLDTAQLEEWTMFVKGSHLVGKIRYHMLENGEMINIRNTSISAHADFWDVFCCPLDFPSVEHGKGKVAND